MSWTAPLRKRAFARVGITLLAATASVGYYLVAPAASATTGSEQRIAVPAYFTSATSWTQLGAGSPTVGMAIINPNSGVGRTKQLSYVSRVASAHASGLRILGYVYSNYGARSANSVTAEIANYFNWYGVDGIFVDEVSDSCGDLGYYQGLANAVKSRSAAAQLVLNPGGNTAECYMATADVIVNYEGTYSSYANWKPSGWVANHAASRFWHLVYNTSRNKLASAVSLSQQRNAGYLYVTSDSTPNPWDTLPASEYWKAESAAVAAGRVVGGAAPSATTTASATGVPSVSATPSVTTSASASATRTLSASASASATKTPSASASATNTSATPTTSASSPSGSWWAPAKGTDWQWQLTGSIDTSVTTPVFDIDGEDASSSLVSTLHAKGAHVICYFSAGSWEDWRSDASSFPASVQGKTLDGWPDEKWLDVRNTTVLLPLMEKRIQMCQAKGFDAVEPDNTDGYSNSTGFSISAAQQLTYNRALADLAHKYGMGIAQKNNSEQAAALQPAMDFAIVEECAAYDECDAFSVYPKAGKAVLHVEYSGSLNSFCPSTKALGFSSMLKKLDLDAWRSVCP